MLDASGNLKKENASSSLSSGMNSTINSLDYEGHDMRIGDKADGDYQKVRANTEEDEEFKDSVDFTFKWLRLNTKTTINLIDFTIDP